jgi:hypothetical protein
MNTIKLVFQEQISPNRDYQRFRLNKNKLLSLFDCKDLMKPSVALIKKVLDDVNIVTNEEHLNIVMFICAWEPTFHSLADEWIECFLSAGIRMDHKDIYGFDTQHYLDKFNQ